MAASTLELYELLKSAGWQETQARERARLLLTIDDKEHLATKADLARLEANLTKEIHNAMWAQIRWLFGIQIVAFSAMGGVFAGIVKWVLQP